MKHTHLLSALCASVILSGCAGQGLGPSDAAADADVVPGPVVVAGDTPDFAIGSGGLDPDRLDRTSTAQIATASAVGGGALLGETVASLGDVTQPGLWLRTPLVKAETQGRVTVPGGKSLGVTLLPIAGQATSGSQISLSAMRGLGLGLTDLPALQVFRVSDAG